MPVPVSLYVDLEICQACPSCSVVGVCRPKAFVQPDPGEPPYLDIERCRSCQICVPSCPFHAVRKLSPVL